MESSTIYRYEKYNFRMFTPLLTLVSVIFMIYAEYIGATISFVLGVLLVFSYQGVQIDAAKKLYLKYDRFLSLKVGRWEALSTPSYVTIVRINLSSNRIGPTPIVVPQDKKGARAFKVNLVVDGDERFVSICRGSREHMVDEALRLGQYLGIRVLDYTTSEKKWIL
jgi:hypothetical protein